MFAAMCLFAWEVSGAVKVVGYVNHQEDVVTGGITNFAFKGHHYSFELMSDAEDANFSIWGHEEGGAWGHIWPNGVVAADSTFRIFAGVPYTKVFAFGEYGNTAYDSMRVFITPDGTTDIQVETK